MTDFPDLPTNTRRYEREILRASDALKQGRVDEAERLLDRVLRRQPDSASAHNLRALAFGQRRDSAQALVHAEKAVELDPDNHRFRGNLGTALMKDGQSDAALTHLDRAVAVAPDYSHARRNRGILNAWLGHFDQAFEDLTIAVELEPGRAETRIALADVLIELKRLDEAAVALRAAEKIDGQQSGNWKYMWGRLMFRAGRFAEARLAFTAALLAEPAKMDRYLSLAAANFHCGDVREAEKATRACFRKFASVERASGEPDLRVLVLETLDEGHLGTLPHGPFPYANVNFIAFMSPGRLAYTHVITDYIDALSEVVDPKRFGVVYNNCVVHETYELRNRAQRLERLTVAIPVPVINRPSAVAETTRDRNAKRFASAEGFLFPRTVRIDHGLDLAATMARILENVRLPLILRPLGSHAGGGARLVHTERELEEAVAVQPFSDFYAIEYHDCRSEDGLFRRYRFACVDRQLFSNSLHMATDWNVHGSDREALDWFERGLDREEMSFYDEPESLLGGAPEAVFREIVANTPLDIYGFDFGVRQDGRLVVFEINAAMALGLDVDFDKYSYRKPYSFRFAAAVERLLISRRR